MIVSNRYSKIDIENEEDIEELFFDYFNRIKGYQDWTDEEIIGSANVDDIDEFVEYIRTTTKKALGIKS